MSSPEICKDRAFPDILQRGRPKGSGRNIEVLLKMGPGDTVWEVPKNKMLSYRSSAKRYGIKISIRKLESGRYVFRRL